MKAHKGLFLVYVEGCTPKIKKFKTMKRLKAFIDIFYLTHTHNTDDNWIEFIIEGNITPIAKDIKITSGDRLIKKKGDYDYKI